MANQGVRVRVRGVVQGVGFRPFVWRLAQELDLSGSVRNDAEGVLIEAAGAAAALDELIRRLRADAPPLARVDAIERAAAEVRAQGFAVCDSAGGPLATAIGPDAAVCPDCLDELTRAADRRYRYAFTTCTHCGPRYTIARTLPYDRATTSLEPFPLCPACAAEYADPGDRRFHAEATCCPDCGPRLALVDAAGVPIPGDPIAETLRRLWRGEVVAIKGLGGFHLACDAGNADAVARLRARKAREEKPFAVMAASIAALAVHADIGEHERALLESAAAPIVLCRKRAGGDAALPGIAPGLAWLGVMLPSTPIHWLLFFEAAGRPSGRGWRTQPVPLMLVMTSANPGGEPLVIGNAEARSRLAGIADAFLLHDRDIVARADDSVLRVSAGTPQFLRRGRGHTPLAIRLPEGPARPSTLAFGGWFKNTVCVTRGDEAFLSTHVGDLDNAATCAFLDETVARLLDLTGVRPERVACDRHPDFYSSQAAAGFAQAHGLPLVPVQHHHAHIAAVCAEHGVEGPVLGLAMDGVGAGDDGGAWGGELLWVDGAVMRRVGHLAPLRLPGGDRAAREPWRVAAGVLADAGRGEEIATRFPDQPGSAQVAQMLVRDLNCPPTTSLGRHFDAAAGLLGVQPVMRFEAQAAMRLEGLAETVPVPQADDVAAVADAKLDLHPLLLTLADTNDAATAAARFHADLAARLAAWAIAHARALGVDTIAAGGGCWLNALLADGVRGRVSAAGLRFLEAHRAPPGDGGLSLGQAWVAMNGVN